jgi:hypothetical protein
MRNPAFRTDVVAVRLRKPAMTVVTAVAEMTQESNTRAGVEGRRT